MPERPRRFVSLQEPSRERLDLRISDDSNKKALLLAVMYGITVAQLFERLMEDADELLTFMS
jgi:hypothetical protein